MRTLTTKLLSTILVLTFISPALAGSLPNSNTEVDQSKIVENLVAGIKSDNLGLKTSSLYHLGSYDSEKAIIELLRALKDEKIESARISAALSLIKLGDARGIYAVKRAIKFDDSERVRNLCEKFYCQFRLKKES